MRATSYEEGDWFAVPIPGGGFGTGLIARAGREGILLGYFFGPRHTQVPSLEAVARLRPADAILVGMFSHLGLASGRWPNLGRSDPWVRRDWPTPVFTRYEELTHRTFEVHYADDDPGRVVRENPVVAGPRGMTNVPDGLMGAGFLEEILGALVG